MTANDIAEALFTLSRTIDACVHGADYLDAEVDQLIDAYRRLTNHYALLLANLAAVDARPDGERVAAGTAIAAANTALRSASGKDERRRAIARCFEVNTVMKALLPVSRLS